MKKLLLVSFFLACTISNYSQVANDDCSTAQNIGTLPTPNPCPNGNGASVNINGTLNGATPANPYTFMPNCTGSATSTASPANDVWYTFTASGYQLNLTINSTFANPNVAMYSGTCAALGGGVGGCAVGANGTVNLVVNQLVPGTSYILQISGNTGQTGTFSMILQNSIDCNNCLGQSTLTANPLPINGAYQPGQVVNFCYTISGYTQVNTNWMHGLQVSFGSGWSGISNQVPAASLSGNGVWIWLNSCTSTATGQTFGQGFYYDDDGDNNPGNNFGDDCGALTGNPCPAGSSWTFCFSLTVQPGCNPGSNLSVTINSTGDGESGSWNNQGCTSDPFYAFAAAGSCCPPTMAATALTCAGNDGTATATPNGNTGPYTFNWTGPGGFSQTTANVSGANTISNLAAGTYSVAITDVNLCQVISTVVVPPNNQNTPAPNTTPVTYCQGDIAVALLATPSAGGSLNWYGTNAVGGTASNLAPTPSTALSGTFTYYVSQSINGCEGPRAPLVVTVNAIPSAPAAPNVSYCQNQAAAALTATPSAGGTLNWYTVPAGGTGSTNAPIPSTATPGVSIYYVSQTINGCEGPRTQITVTINAIPSAPIVAPITYCQNDPTNPLIASGSPGATLNWYGTSAVGGIPSAAAPTPSSLVPGLTTYYVSQSINGCEGPRSPIDVTINATPALPTVTTPVTYCQNDAAVALIASPSAGGTLNWYGTNAVGGVASTIAPIPSTSTPGNTSYYVSQTINSCEGPRSQIVVTVNPTPPSPVVLPLTYCQNDVSVALTATTVPGATLNWWGTNSTGGTSSTAAPTPATSNSGQTTYYVSQTLNGCEGPRASITVTVNQTPSAPLVAPINYCLTQNTSSLTAQSSPGGTLNWYGISAVGGVASPVAPIPSSNVVAVTTYYVSQTINGCEGPRSPLVVTVNPLPSGTLDAVDPGCKPLCTIFNITTSDQISAVNWNIGGTLIQGNNLSQNYCFQNAGIYSVSFTLTNQFSCSNTFYFDSVVTVFALPIANFEWTPNPVSILEPIANFLNTSYGQNISGVNWTITDPYSADTISNAYNPSHTYSSPGIYPVTLIVNTPYCSDSITQYVLVQEDWSIYVPNAFTPNEDGINDFFYPKGTGIDETHYELWVFDRWGEMIFYTKDWNEHWDGKVLGKSKDVQQDVYVWKIKSKSFKGDKINLSGHVSVVK